MAPETASDKPPMSAHGTTEEQGRAGDSCTLVIFGASGDLTKRKLLPSLYNLARKNLLPANFALIGFALDKMDDNAFRDLVHKDLKEFAAAPDKCDFCDWLLQRLYYLSGDFNDPAAYARLKDLLATVDEKHGTQGNYFYYLATLPQFFSEIVKQLGGAGLTEESAGRWRHVVIEKPFGSDLESARSLNHELNQVLTERQIYRIDHYLGKETVQNILVFRFSNGIFEPIWNRRYIDHVQITVAESLGVELRGSYYDRAGCLRDMVPNHILQLVTLTAMEPPISFQADAVRDEQAKILHAIQQLTPEDVLLRAVRGQYGEGHEEGKPVAGYRSEPNVDHHSETETFVALKLSTDNWRWADVPFYVRTGNAWPAGPPKSQFSSRAPFVLFRETPVEHLTPNLLVMHIPAGGRDFASIWSEYPGPIVRVGFVDIDFHYTDYFGSEPSTGYERLLYDCMIGDATLFQRADMVEAGWSVVQPILDVWKALPPRNFPNYQSGAWGPKKRTNLIKRDGRTWHQ